MDDSTVRLPLGPLSGQDDRDLTLLQHVQSGTLIGARLPAGLHMPAPDYGFTVDWDAPEGAALVVDWESSATNTAAHHPPADGGSRYVATEHMRWGDGWLAPGDPVPDYEPARDYAALFAEGKIAHASPGVLAAIDAQEVRDGHR